MLLVLLLLSACSEAEEVRICTYNIKNGTASSLDEVAAALAAENFDLVALQEAEPDTVQRLAVMLDSPFVAVGDYGKALVSRSVSIGKAYSYPLTGGRWPRSLNLHWIEVGGQHTILANVHFDVREDDRLQQMHETHQILQPFRRALSMGDFNAFEEEAGMQEVFLSLGWRDLGPTTEFDGYPRIDYILARPGDMALPIMAWWSNSLASDHPLGCVDVIFKD